MIPPEFLALFEAPAPGLLLQPWELAGFPKFGVAVTNRLGAPASQAAVAAMDAITAGGRLEGLHALSVAHDGADLCVRMHPRRKVEAPLLRLEPAERWAAITQRFMPGGESASVVDLNQYQKARTLYRGAERWMVFATCTDGPVLTTFLEGPNAGAVFCLAIEPGFNIVRPVAKDVHDLLVRLGTDLAGFLRLCRVNVTFRGPSGAFFYLKPGEFVRDHRGHADFHGRDPYP